MPHPAPAHKSFSDRSSLYQEITAKIIAELEQGRLPWVQPWGSHWALDRKRPIIFVGND